MGFTSVAVEISNLEAPKRSARLPMLFGSSRPELSFLNCDPCLAFSIPHHAFAQLMPLLRLFLAMLILLGH